MAALAHFFGPIVALIVWATQKDKSPYLRFQALQALAFDLSLLLGNLAIGVCAGVLAVGGIALLAGRAAGAGGSRDPALFFAPALFALVIWIPLLPCLFASTALRLWAVVQVLQGRNFRYPWLGARVERFAAHPPA